MSLNSGFSYCLFAAVLCGIFNRSYWTLLTLNGENDQLEKQKLRKGDIFKLTLLLESAARSNAGLTVVGNCRNWGDFEVHCEKCLQYAAVFLESLICCLLCQLKKELHIEDSSKFKQLINK